MASNLSRPLDIVLQDRFNIVDTTSSTNFNKRIGQNKMCKPWYIICVIILSTYSLHILKQFVLELLTFFTKEFVLGGPQWLETTLPLRWRGLFVSNKSLTRVINAARSQPLRFQIPSLAILERANMPRKQKYKYIRAPTRCASKNTSTRTVRSRAKCKNRRGRAQLASLSYARKK